MYHYFDFYHQAATFIHNTDTARLIAEPYGNHHNQYIVFVPIPQQPRR